MATIEFLKSKIHGAKVTNISVQDLSFIAIDANLMAAAELKPYEKIMVGDQTNGERLETYVVPADPGSGTISVNGAAAQKISKDHRIILFSWIHLTTDEADGFHPKLVFVDDQNHIESIKKGTLAG